VIGAAFGLSAVFALVPAAYWAVKLAGAAYLIWLGLTMIFRRDDREPATARVKSPRRAFLESIAVEVLNPKTAVFFIAFLPQFADPSAAPQVFVTNSAGIGDNIFTFDGGYVFYEDGEAFGNAMLLNTADGTFTQLTENPSAGQQCHNGGTFVYFVDRDANDSNGNDNRSGIGTIPGPGAALAGDMEIDGATTNNGFFGWAQTCAVTPDGAYAFLSGTGSIGSGEFLQVGSGGAFMLLPDPDGSSEYGLPATDVVVSSSLVGFKTGAGTTAGASTKVGYIRLGDQ